MKAVGITLDPSQLRTESINAEGTRDRGGGQQRADRRHGAEQASSTSRARPASSCPPGGRSPSPPASGDWYTLVDADDRHGALAQEHPRARIDPRRALQRLRAGRRRDAGRQPGAAVAHHGRRRAPARSSRRSPARPSACSTAQDIVASPNGWIDDCPGGVCTANETQTLGNNVVACVDRAAGAAPTSATPTLPACSTATAGRPATRTPTPATATSWAPRPATTPTPRRPQGGNPEAGDTPTGVGTPTARSLPPRRHHAALLRLQLVPRQALPARLRRGRGQLPADQLQRHGPRRRPGAGRRAGRLGHEQRQLRHAAGRHVRPHADVPLHRSDHRPRRRPRRRDRHPRADPRHLQPADRQRRRPHLGARAAAWARAGATSTLSPCSTTPTPTTPTPRTRAAPTPRTSSAACSTTTSTASAASPTRRTTRSTR